MARIITGSDDEEPDARALIASVLELGHLLTERGIQPNVHEDEDGVSLYWRVGPVSVQIDVTGGADFYMRIRNRSTGGVFESYDWRFPVAEGQSALNQLGAGDRGAAEKLR